MSPFDEILESIAEQPMQLRRAAYVSALRRADWGYRWSDDGATYRRGKDIVEALKHEQEQIDPNFELWDANAPIEFWRGAIPL